MRGDNFHVTPEMEEEDFNPSQMASQLESSGSEFEVATRRRKKKKVKQHKTRASKRVKKSKHPVKKKTRTKRNTKVAAKNESKLKTKVLKVYADKGPPALPTIVLPLSNTDNLDKITPRQIRKSTRVKAKSDDARRSKRKIEVKSSPSIIEVEEFLDPPIRDNNSDIETHAVVKQNKPAVKQAGIVKDLPRTVKKRKISAVKHAGKKTRDINPQKKRKKSGTLQQVSTKESVKKKRKVKVLSKSDAKQTLKDYMLSENRPYTHSVLFDNLKQMVKKSMLPTLLSELADENVLTKKAWKKTIVYWANQDNFPSVTSTELASMDTRIKELEIENKAINEKHARVASEVRKLEKEPTDAELEAEMEELTSKAKAMRARVDKLTKGSTPLIDVNMYEKLGKEFLKYFKHYKKRRAGCRKLAEGITEHLRQKPKDWLKKNCDLDEDYGIDYKSYKALVEEWKERLKK